MTHYWPTDVSRSHDYTISQILTNQPSNEVTHHHDTYIITLFLSSTTSCRQYNNHAVITLSITIEYLWGIIVFWPSSNFNLITNSLCVTTNLMHHHNRLPQSINIRQPARSIFSSGSPVLPPAFHQVARGVDRMRRDFKHLFAVAWVRTELLAEGIPLPITVRLYSYINVYIQAHIRTSYWNI